MQNAGKKNGTESKRWNNSYGTIFAKRRKTCNRRYARNSVFFFHDMVVYKLMFPSFSVNLEFKRTDTLFFRVVVLAPVPVGRGKSTNSV